MHFRALTWTAVFIALALNSSIAEPANTLAALHEQIRTCLKDARIAEESAVTVVIFFKPDGNIAGKPLISYAQLPTDPQARARVVETVAQALDRCLPVSITPALGAAIVGRRYVIRFGAPRRTNARDI